MTEGNPRDMTASETPQSGRGAPESPQGMSPYATGGGGVTFERQVAVKYLAHMLAGDGASELGDGRHVVNVAFQQAPTHPADDLVVSAAHSDESQPSLVLAIAVRRSPKLVRSDESTRRLFRGFVRALVDTPKAGPEHRWGLVVAGDQPHARQLAQLVSLAGGQSDAPGFFDCVNSPGRYDIGVRRRLGQIEALVERALTDLDVGEVDTTLVRRRVWELLTRLEVRMPRLESPDDTDWSNVANSLIPLARGSGLEAAVRLRDRLVALANEYAPKAARVDLAMLRRDTHLLINPAKRHRESAWLVLDRLHQAALASVRAKITSGDGIRQVRLDRSELAAKLVNLATEAAAVVVTGESGVGKSALALFGLAAASKADPDSVQVFCVNLRHIPRRPVEFEATLGGPLPTLLQELSAPRRLLVIDGADAVIEGMEHAFRHLVDAAKETEMAVVAVTSRESAAAVRSPLIERFASGVTECGIPPLTDAEIAEIGETFAELKKLYANPQSREVLRRLVVVDLLVRGRVHDVPLSDADAMREVWSGLVRRREMSDKGSPDAREFALLRLAELELIGGDRLEVMSGIDSTALDGLRQDGLLRTSPSEPFRIGPEFAHDEVRRYAVARLLLAERNPVSRIKEAGAPRWSLSAARLACQEHLALPDTAGTPLCGRFAALQGSFAELVKAGHGARWEDLPTEALLTIANPSAVLGDAWPGLLADQRSGVRRIARLVDQRLRDDSGTVDIVAVEPVITLLLDDSTPWRSGDAARDLLRSWLRAHVATNTPAGNPLRVLLRDRLVEACGAADRRFAKKQAALAAKRAARTPEEIERERRFEEKHAWAAPEIRRRRKRPGIPHEITSEIVVELLGLLGPDLGHEGEAILRRVARDAPAWLAPAVDDFFASRALASFGQDLLAHLTEAYYIDDEADGSDSLCDGVRGHQRRRFLDPLAAWHLGPFMSLFQVDFRRGITILNRLLNHAAVIRAVGLARATQGDQPAEDESVHARETAIEVAELEVTGERKPYVGDQHVWRWYRGTGVGPSPCLSALLALERACDQLVDSGVSLSRLIQVLFNGCENLAMVGFIVGLLVRHLEKADQLLDPYLVEPLIWHHEFARVANESSGFAAESEGLVAPERRDWSLNHVAMFLVLGAAEERVAALRAVGATLVGNAERQISQLLKEESGQTEDDHAPFIEQQLMPVRAWASRLDRDRYEARETPDGVYIQATPPDEVVQGLAEANADMERTRQAIELGVRYHVEPGTGNTGPHPPDQLTADLTTARELLEKPPSFSVYDPLDTAALVAAAALEAHFLTACNLPHHALSFAAKTVLQIGEGAVEPRPFEYASTLFDQGADRSAARVLPLLLLPGSEPIRAAIDSGSQQTPIERVLAAGRNLARAVANEVRLYLVRRLDHVWEAACVNDDHCHHELGLSLVTSTLQDCIVGPWVPDTGRRSAVALEEPLAESLATTDDDSVITFRLDAAIRALGPAVFANVCISTRAHVLLTELLAAQRRSLLRQEQHHADHRGTHSLVTARALLTIAQNGDDAGIYQHIDAYANNPALVGTILRALSAAAEETPSRAATARRIWPGLVRHVLELNASGHTPFQGGHYGDMALASLIPSTAPEWHYLYREVVDQPIKWWSPRTMRPAVEEWLPVAAGTAECVDHLIGFLSVLSPEDQVRVGLPWLKALVLSDPASIAAGSFMIADWLTEHRTAAVAADLMPSWQEVVDALVVAGDTRLATYSD
ncbi:MAG: hypothetical protein OXN18_01800 [Gemmatimonadota bacterium]|nr:hypothetical protein [Gemmatimonadota bacterium]